MKPLKPKRIRRRVRLNSELEGIIRRIQATDNVECWKWNGGHSGAGYAAISFNGSMRSVSRILWELMHGPIEPGMVVDHTCGNRWCVNIYHWQKITNRENVYKGRRWNNEGL